MQSSDSQAISAVLRGDKSSYEALVERHKRMVYGIAWSHLGDADLSEDAAQETFIKAYAYLGTLREPDKFAGWLARIARNVCNSFRRSAKRERAFKERLTVLEAAETEPRVDERESISEPLWDSFADLSPAYREALTAFYIEGKSVADAAAALGISEQALRTRLHRARTALREQLEQRLEDTLGELSPSRNFTRSVLVLLPLSPKGVLGAGIAGIFAKLLASVSFALWAAVASTLPLAAFYGLISKTDESSLSDAPEYQPIKARIRRGYRKAVIGMFIAFAVCWLLLTFVSSMTMMKWIAVLYGCIMLLAIYGGLIRRRIGTNSATAIISVVNWGIMFVAIAAIAFFGAPIVLFPIAALALGILSCFVMPKTPQGLQQIGTNPFLRGTMGLPEAPDVDFTPGRKLTKLDLRTFARLLAGIGIVRDYRFHGDAISIILTGMKPHRLAGLGLVAGDSEITITPDGACTATISDSDLKVAREFVGTAATAEEFRSQACRAVRYSLDCFVRGDAKAGFDALSFTADGSTIAQSPCSTRNHWVKTLVTVWIGVVCVVEFTAPTAVLMIVAAVVGFSVAFLALAINLYINRRERRSA